jgi:phytoene dehydrogenase-like protein
LSDYDIVIIGSGIGGTAIGALLAAKDFNTILIEKNELIGGRCSTYKKDGFKVDVGVHSFARSDKGPLGKVLELINMEGAINWSIVGQGESQWHYKGGFYGFPEDLRKFLPKKDLLKLLGLISEVSKMKDTSKLDEIDVKSWLTQYTNNSLIHRYFYLISGLYFVIPYQQVSAGEFIRCLTSLNKYQRVGYPEGGCISIPLAYTEGIKKKGGKILTKTTVKKIVIEDGKVNGVELENGESISSDIVISNAGVKDTVNRLVGREHFKNEFLQKIDNLSYSLSAITLKLALKKSLTPYKMIISFGSENVEEYYSQLSKGKVPDEIDYFIPIPSNYHSSMAPKEKQLLTAGTMLPLENFEKNKKKWIENSFSTLEKVFPGLTNNLLWYDITTPEDIDLMYGKESSVVGIAQTNKQSGINRPPISLPIEGLYMVGGDAGGWGIGTELAAMSALECSKIILEKHSISK